MKGIKILTVLAMSFLYSHATFAQEEQAIQQVIANIFEGMKNKDLSLIEPAFLPTAQMQTVNASVDGATVGSNTVQDFFNRIATTPPETVLDEQILDYQIKIDGLMAAAWTPYRFYVNGAFSHCGVNSFQLVKTAEGWKITYIIDTRRKEGCD